MLFLQGKNKKARKKIHKGKYVAIALAFVVGMTSVGGISTAFAARGGSSAPSHSVSTPKVNLSKPAPSKPKTSQPAVTERKAGPNNRPYEPSKSAKDLSNEPPAPNSARPQTPSTTPAPSAAPTPQPQQQSGTRWGNIMRNVGLFAGGMAVGGLLSHLLGGGSVGASGAPSMMGDILGLLVNLAILVAIVLGARTLWNRFRAKKNNNANANNNFNHSPANQTPPLGNDLRNANETKPPVMDIAPPKEEGYDPKTMADKYRKE